MMNVRPVYEMLTELCGRESLHMPGHKGRGPYGAVDPYALDATELPVTDDLYCPERGLKAAEALYAKAAGAAETLFLHNGSTAGIHVMIQLYAGEGDTILLPRNAHLSAQSGCVLGGVNAVWMPFTQTADGYCYAAEETVLRAMDEHPGAKAVLLTRPDYFGGCMPLKRVTEKARRLGMRVIVDEAHGAHFPWLQGMDSAGAAGADAWVQSVHKTLPGLTGAAVLHLRDGADRPRAMRVLRREQTSSPSFLLMMSIDDARAMMEERGAAMLAGTARLADAVRAQLPALGYRDAHALWRGTGQLFDPTRLVIDAPQGGFALAQALADAGIDAEMADDRRVVLILTAMDDAAAFARLTEALRRLPPVARGLPRLPDMTRLPPVRLTLRRGAMAESETVPLSRAAGRIAGTAAGLYPPGIPLVCPGEEITEETAAMLSRAGNRQRFGTEEEGIVCIK